MKSFTPQGISRREMIQSSVALAAVAFAQYPLSLFGGPEAEAGGVLIPFLDVQPPVKKQTRWENLTSWMTKNDDLYVVRHYNTPTINADDHSLEISGLVRKPKKFSLKEIKARKRKTITATLECGGNGLGPGFMGFKRRRVRLLWQARPQPGGWNEFLADGSFGCLRYLHS